MSILTSIIIATAIVGNLVRLQNKPPICWIFSMPLWLYLAWVQWGPGTLHTGIAIAGFVLLLIGEC